MEHTYVLAVSIYYTFIYIIYNKLDSQSSITNVYTYIYTLDIVKENHVHYNEGDMDLYIC